MKNRTLKALSLTLSYPTAELQEAMPAIAAVFAADPRITLATRAGLQSLAAALGQGDLYDLQERYVMLFDRSRTLSLNLFEHVHGESRDRGGAMVSLIETYRRGGFEPATTELPDHLPVLLEFLSTRPFAEAQETLADAAHIFDALSGRLVRRESGYADAFALFPSLRAAGRTPKPSLACWHSQMMTRPISPHSIQFGRKPKSPSGPIQTRDARRYATCWP